jgi:hypothetical protein
MLMSSFGWTSCNYDQRTTQEIQQLIDGHKKQHLFLTFWPGMSKSDFTRVLEMENERGNLEDGKFILKVPKETRPNAFPQFDEVDFSIENQESSINLNYKHQDTKEFHGVLPSGDGQSEYYRYGEIRDFLIKTYNSKYQLIEGDGSYYRVWKITKVNRPEKVIRFYYSAYGYEGSYSTSRAPRLSHNQENWIMAECSIDLTYMTYEEFLRRKRDRQKDDEDWERRKKDELKQAKKNNNRL